MITVSAATVVVRLTIRTIYIAFFAVQRNVGKDRARSRRSVLSEKRLLDLRGLCARAQLHLPINVPLLNILHAVE